MKKKEAHFTTADGLKIYYQVWEPNTPKAIVQIVHGFGEHSGRYSNVVEKLVPVGYMLYATDHRGHGKSEGVRTYVDSFNQFVKDQRMFHEVIRNDQPNLPIFMLGHSMGSFIAAHFAFKHESLLQGLILSGTGVLPGGFLNLVAAASLPVLRIMAFFTPKLRLNVSLGSGLSRDPEVRRAYESDPLVVKTITAKLGFEMINAVTKMKRMICKLRLPLLIQCGSEDWIARGIKEIEKQLAMEDKTIRIYNGLRHEVYNELEEDREKVLNDLVHWLDSHV
ncbi:MAG: lysophospholipase [Candidatus Helarchaeota archaeon]